MAGDTAPHCPYQPDHSKTHPFTYEGMAGIYPRKALVYVEGRARDPTILELELRALASHWKR